ncbi:Phosphoribosylamine--glycine ligase [compost metagenome]
MGVVLAAGGYPGDYAKGDVIEGLDAAAELDGKVFHAGTALNDAGQVVTSGGRVLCATAIGPTVASAQQQAYRLAEQIRWSGMFYRHDIGYRAIARERGEG